MAYLYLFAEYLVKPDSHYRIIHHEGLDSGDGQGPASFVVDRLLERANGFPVFDCSPFVRNHVLLRTTATGLDSALWWDGQTYIIRGRSHGSIEFVEMVTLLGALGDGFHNDPAMAALFARFEQSINTHVDMGNLHATSIRFVYYIPNH